jgi:hypothetical protein
VITRSATGEFTSSLSPYLLRDSTRCGKARIRDESDSGDGAHPRRVTRWELTSGGIWRTVDGGRTWARIKNLPSIHMRGELWRAFRRRTSRGV